jgi:hypothetical protein
MFVCEPAVVWMYQVDRADVGASGQLTQYPWMWAGEIVVGAACWLVFARAMQASRPSQT